MKAIKTFYHNIKFRSRLEARWAVVMDCLGIKWIYESEGFNLGKLKYLPDFFLPELQTYLEIKPFKPTKLESKKCELLCEETKKKVVCMFGQPIDYLDYENEGGFAYLFSPGGDVRVSWDNWYRFCICSKCKKAGIEFENRNDRLNCKCNIEEDGRGKRDKIQTYLLKNIYITAQNFNFENF